MTLKSLKNKLQKEHAVLLYQKPYFTDEEVSNILQYKWLPEVGATVWETFLSTYLYKPLEYLIYWKLNANFLSLAGPIPMALLSIWLFFFSSENPPRITQNGREGGSIPEWFYLAYGLSMIFSSLIDAFDGIRARRQGCGSTFGGFFDCFMDGVAAYLETNLFLYMFAFQGGDNAWNLAITLIPPLYLYTIQMRMVNAKKAKYNCGQIGPTESESLIGLLTLIPAVFGRDVYETMMFQEYGIQAKHLACGAYIIVQILLVADCTVEAIYCNPKESLRMYLPMIPLQVLFFIGTQKSSLGFLGEYGLYNLMFQTFFHLQYIILCVEDLTGVSKGNSRFPGYDYLWITVPFAIHHILQLFPLILSHSVYLQQQLVVGSAVLITLYGMIKLYYIVFSMLAQTFTKLGRPSFYFNHDKKALRAA